LTLLLFHHDSGSFLYPYFYYTFPGLSVIVSFLIVSFLLICVMFLFSVGTLTSLLEDELLVIMWTDIFAFSLHVKLLLNCFILCENLGHSLFFVV